MSDQIIVKNLRYEKPNKAYQIKVDRISPLGNPFKMASENERNFICDRYRVYLNEQVKNEIKKLRLFNIKTLNGET